MVSVRTANARGPMLAGRYGSLRGRSVRQLSGCKVVEFSGRHPHPALSREAGEGCRATGYSAACTSFSSRAASAPRTLAMSSWYFSSTPSVSSTAAGASSFWFR